jgi:hypothetical protein
MLDIIFIVSYILYNIMTARCIICGSLDYKLSTKIMIQVILPVVSSIILVAILYIPITVIEYIINIIIR